MPRFLSLLVLLLLLPLPAHASVELALTGQPPVTIKEVYLRDGMSYLAVNDVLAPLHLSGHWDSVEHVYRIETPRGTAVISPGSHYLRIGGNFIPLSHLPRFIDGRLRVAEDFVTAQMPNLLGVSVYYRNLNPQPIQTPEGETPLDRLFAFLLRKKNPEAGSTSLRAVAIDPGHGGQDPGSIGIDGLKEKTISLEIARRLEKRIKMDLGIPIYLSRDGDYALTPQQRLEPAGHPDVDAFLLLHAEAAFNVSPHGICLLVRPQEESENGVLPAEEGESMRLARCLEESLRQDGFLVDGIFRAPLLPLGRGNLPTVMLELGFLSNPEDAALLRDQSAQEKLAEALFTGLKKFANGQKETAN
jgi:N-acetylmuramoyl-L-alanine amidase